MFKNVDEHLHNEEQKCVLTLENIAEDPTVNEVIKEEIEYMLCMFDHDGDVKNLKLDEVILLHLQTSLLFFKIF